MMKSYLYKVFTLLVFAINFFSCSKKEDSVMYLADSDFELSGKLELKKISLLNKVYMPAGMIKVKDGVIIFDDGLKDSLFHYITIDNENFKSDLVYGRKGRGENEFAFPTESVFSQWNNGFYIADHLSIRFYESIFGNNDQIKYASKKISPKVGVYQGGVILGDSSFFGYSTGNDEKEFVLTKLDSDELKWFGDFFDTPIQNPSPTIAIQVYSKMFTSNPANNKVAVFYHYAKRFKIFDLSRNFEFKEFVFSDGFPFSIKEVDHHNVDMSEAHCYYSRIYSSEKYIYVLYYGEVDEEIGNNENIKAKVHVYDWDGNPIANYKLEDVYSTFCVTGDSVIYAASPFDIEHLDAYKFKL